MAYDYLCNILRERITNNFLGKESELTKSLKSDAASELGRKILLAPDMFYAAALMTQNKLYYGNGDFKQCIEMLQQENNPDFKDVANKLVLLKTGHLYQKGLQVDVDDTRENAGIKLYKDWTDELGQRCSLYSDKVFDKTPENNAITKKHVFKIWSKQVYQKPGMANPGLISYRQLYNIFPEFREKL